MTTTTTTILRIGVRLSCDPTRNNGVAEENDENRNPEAGQLVHNVVHILEDDRSENECNV